MMRAREGKERAAVSFWFEGHAWGLEERERGAHNNNAIKQ